MPDELPGTGNILDVDTREAACSATRYLIAPGHERIAHISGIHGHAHARARLLGYQQALTEASLPLLPNLVVEGQFDEPSGQAAVETLLTRGEHSVVGFDDVHRWRVATLGGNMTAITLMAKQRSYHEFAEGYSLRRGAIQWFWDPAQCAEVTASALRRGVMRRGEDQKIDAVAC